MASSETSVRIALTAKAEHKTSLPIPEECLLLGDRRYETDVCHKQSGHLSRFGRNDFSKVFPTGFLQNDRRELTSKVLFKCLRSRGRVDFVLHDKRIPTEVIGQSVCKC